MTITKEQLKTIAPYAKDSNINKYLPGINTALNAYANTPLRAAHFLAQVLHESGSLKYNEEIASGEAYENRRDLGNTFKGDGRKFKGRGLIQLTGRSNYREFGRSIGVDLEANPEHVGTVYAATVAGWFWNKKQLNQHADMDDVGSVTRKINGGYNGLDDRKQFLARAKKALGL